MKQNINESSLIFPQVNSSCWRVSLLYAGHSRLLLLGSLLSCVLYLAAPVLPLCPSKVHHLSSPISLVLLHLPALQGAVYGWRRLGSPCPARHLSLSPCDFRRCETRDTSDRILVGGLPDIKPTSWLAHRELAWLNYPRDPTSAGC